MPPRNPTLRPKGELDRPVQARGQSHLASLAEAFCGVLIGFWISVLANRWLLPFWGYQVSMSQAIEIGLLFTWISILRSYLLRRLFNFFHISKHRG